MKRLLFLLFLILLGGWQAASAQYLGTASLTAAASTDSACVAGISCFSVNPLQDSASVSFTISGTFSATLNFEVAQDGVNFVAVNAFPPSSTTGVTSTTSPGTWTSNVPAMATFRIRCNPYTSGTVVITVSGSKGVSTNAFGGGSGAGGTVTSVSCVTGCTVANPTTTPAITVTGSGTVQSGAQFTPLEYTGAGTTTTVGPTPACTPPTVNGTYDVLYSITGGTATDPSCPQLGLFPRSVSGSVSSDTILYSDVAAGEVDHEDATGTVALTMSLPTPTTLGNSAPVFTQCNLTATFTDTLTPVTWTISSPGNPLAASASLPPKTCWKIRVDALNASNWIATPTGPGTNLLTPMISNGVSNSFNYSGATSNVRINAANADAVALTNGNTSGIVNATGEGTHVSAGASVLSTINVGSSLQNPVSLKLPPTCYFSATGFTGGTTSVVQQFGNTDMSSEGGRGGCVFESNSTTNGVFATYQTTAGDSYYHVRDVNFYNRASGTASGAACVIGGAADNSYWEDMVCANYIAGQSSMLIGGTSTLGSPCCSISLPRDTNYGNNSSGIVEDIEGSNTFGSPRDVYHFGGSDGHPAAGVAVMRCRDQATQKNNVSIGWFGYYEETNNTDTTTAVNQVDGCARIVVVGEGIEKASSGASNAPGWSLTNASPTSMFLAGLGFYTFNVPVVAVQNNITALCPSETISSTSCNVLSDLQGHLSEYASEQSWADQRVTFTSENTVFVNDASTGTTLNKLVKLGTTAGTAVIAATTDTNGIIGIVTSHAGTAGSATIAQSGQAQCVFSNAAVANDYVQISTAVGGDCVDVGATRPTSGEIIGQVLHAGSAGTYWVLLSLNYPSISGTPANTSLSNLVQTITYASNKAYVSGSGTSAQTAAFGSANASGNAILVWVRFQNGTADLTGCTDLNGDTFAIALQLNGPSNENTGFAYATNISAGSANKVTCSTTGAHTGFVVYAEEWSGIVTASPVDVTSSNTVSLGTSVSAPLTTTVAGDLIVAATNVEGTFSAVTVGPGFTANDATALTNVGAEYLLTTASGGFSPSLSWTSNAYATMVAVAFKPGAGTNINGNLLPYTDNTLNIGSASLRWANGYFTNQAINGGILDASAATQEKLPVAAGYASLANGETGYDSTNNNFHAWVNGADTILAPLAPGFVSGHCGQPLSTGGSWVIADSGSVCGTSGGNTSSTGLTSNSLPKANGANSIINSLFTDSGTVGSYTGTGGLNSTTSLAAEGTPFAQTGITANTFVGSGATAYGIYVQAPTGATANYTQGWYNSTGATAEMLLNNSGTLSVAGFFLPSNLRVTWTNNTTVGSGTADTGLCRASAGVVEVANSTTCNASGTLNGGAVNAGSIGATTPGTGAFTTLKGTTINTTTNCASAASPAVCSSAAAGEVTIAAAASTITVNTTAVTANSEIMLTQDISTNGGTRLSVTCNTTPITLAVSAITAGTSFQITSASAALTNPDCIYFSITN